MLDRSRPNFGTRRVYADSSGNGCQLKKIIPRDSKGHWGDLGGQKVNKSVTNTCIITLQLSRAKRGNPASMIIIQTSVWFSTEHSTIHPILQLMKDIADANDNTAKYVTLSVFLDLSEAFDTINHDILLKKLILYGIRGVPNSWFANYLYNRKQFTEINNCKSVLTNVPLGYLWGQYWDPFCFYYTRGGPCQHGLMLCVDVGLSSRVMIGPYMPT